MDFFDVCELTGCREPVAPCLCPSCPELPIATPLPPWVTSGLDHTATWWNVDHGQHLNFVLSGSMLLCFLLGIVTLPFVRLWWRILTWPCRRWCGRKKAPAPPPPPPPPPLLLPVFDSTSTQTIQVTVDDKSSQCKFPSKQIVLKCAKCQNQTQKQADNSRLPLARWRLTKRSTSKQSLSKSKVNILRRYVQQAKSKGGGGNGFRNVSPEKGGASPGTPMRGTAVKIETSFTPVSNQGAFSVKESPFSAMIKQGPFSPPPSFIASNSFSSPEASNPFSSPVANPFSPPDQHSVPSSSNRPNAFSAGKGETSAFKPLVTHVPIEVQPAQSGNRSKGKKQTTSLKVTGGRPVMTSSPRRGSSKGSSVGHSASPILGGSAAPVQQEGTETMEDLMRQLQERTKGKDYGQDLSGQTKSSFFTGALTISESSLLSSSVFSLAPEKPFDKTRPPMGMNLLPQYFFHESSASFFPSSFSLFYVEDAEECNNWIYQNLMTQRSDVDGSRMKYDAVGFHVEWAGDAGVEAVLLATNERCILARVSVMEEFPYNLEDVLQSPDVLKAGADIKDDILKLCRRGILETSSETNHGFIDVLEVASECEVGFKPLGRRIGLVQLTSSLLGLDLLSLLSQDTCNGGDLSRLQKQLLALHAHLPLQLLQLLRCRHTHKPRLQRRYLELLDDPRDDQYLGECGLQAASSAWRGASFFPSQESLDKSHERMRERLERKTTEVQKALENIGWQLIDHRITIRPTPRCQMTLEQASPASPSPDDLQERLVQELGPAWREWEDQLAAWRQRQGLVNLRLAALTQSGTSHRSGTSLKSYLAALKDWE